MRVFGAFSGTFSSALVLSLRRPSGGSSGDRATQPHQLLTLTLTLPGSRPVSGLWRRVHLVRSIGLRCSPLSRHSYLEQPSGAAASKLSGASFPPEPCSEYHSGSSLCGLRSRGQQETFTISHATALLSLPSIMFYIPVFLLSTRSLSLSHSLSRSSSPACIPYRARWLQQ